MLSLPEELHNQIISICLSQSEVRCSVKYFFIFFLNKTPIVFQRMKLLSTCVNVNLILQGKICTYVISYNGLSLADTWPGKGQNIVSD